MTVLLLERVSPSLRGELTRWLLEVRTGVFVGTVSAAVRQRLWERARDGLKEGHAVLIYAAPTEQGFRLETAGTGRHTVVDFDGLQLIRFA